jgi:hypothetical protein
VGSTLKVDAGGPATARPRPWSQRRETGLLSARKDAFPECEPEVRGGPELRLPRPVSRRASALPAAACASGRRRSTRSARHGPPGSPPPARRRRASARGTDRRAASPCDPARRGRGRGRRRTSRPGRPSACSFVAPRVLTTGKETRGARSFGARRSSMPRRPRECGETRDRLERNASSWLFQSEASRRSHLVVDFFLELEHVESPRHTRRRAFSPASTRR